MVTTITDYCQKNGVTKQFVYERVRKQKFELIELPVFAEINGQKIGGGTQKFLSVPEAYEPELDFPTFDSAAAFVDYLTDYPELAERNKAYFKLTNAEEKAAFKAAMYAELATRPEAERTAFMAAQARLHEAMQPHEGYAKAFEKRFKKGKKITLG